jgi:hypothetical protein
MGLEILVKMDRNQPTCRLGFLLFGLVIPKAHQGPQLQNDLLFFRNGGFDLFDLDFVHGFLPLAGWFPVKLESTVKPL